MIFQQEAMVNLQSIPVCKTHPASAENTVDLISSNSIILKLVAVESKKIVNSKM